MKRAESKRKMQGKMILFIIGIFMCASSGFSQVDSQVSLDFPNKEKAMQTAKETVRAYETGNWEVLRNHVQQEAFFYNLGSYDSLTLDQTINYWKRGRETAIPDLGEDGVWLPVSVPEGPRRGNWILHWGSNTLRYPNGEKISFPYHVSLKFKNEKVSQVHFYYDNNRIIRGLGYEIQLPMVFDEEETGLEDRNNRKP